LRFVACYIKSGSTSVSSSDFGFPRAIIKTFAAVKSINPLEKEFKMPKT